MSNPTPTRPQTGPGESDSQALAETVRAARVEAGQRLRAAREEAGRSVAELAAQLKVSGSKISALEGGDWSSLHDDAHARGLLRAAAKAVRADADKVLDPLPPPFVPGAPILPPKGATLGPQRAAEPVGTHAGNHRLVWLALLLVVLALALLYLPREGGLGRWIGHVRGWFGHPARVVGVPVQRASLPAAASTPVGAVAPAAAASVPGASPEASASAPTAPLAAASVASAAMTSAAVTGVPAASVPRAASAAAAAAPPGPLLSLQASGQTWIRLRSNSGTVLYTGLLAAGASKQLSTSGADFPLHLTVGNAAQTSVSLGGKPVPLNAGGANVARLLLPAPTN